MLQEMRNAYGPRFEPCAELRRRAENGEKFYPAQLQVDAKPTSDGASDSAKVIGLEGKGLRPGSIS
jgi:hypothetical protein